MTGAAGGGTGVGLELDAVLVRGGFRATVSLGIERGGVLALLGPNGAGKSTVLRAVAGLDPVASGRIVIDGTPVEDTARKFRLPAHRRDVGYVFQDYRLFPHLDVLDNVAFGLRAGGSTRGEARQQANEVLERAGLERFASARSIDLSGGESQQVAVARALATGPGLLLLDEPLAALDVENRALMRERLAELIRGFEVTVLLVTHDPGDALAVTGELAVLEQGRIIQRGSGRELAAAPASAYIARLVGRTGICGEVPAGTLVEPGGEVAFRTGSGPMRGRAAGLLAGDPFPSGPVFASFNPAAVRIGDPGVTRVQAGVPNCWSDARVNAVEHGLEQTMFQIDPVAGGEGPEPFRAATSPERTACLRTGDRVTVEIPPDTIRVTPVRS